MTASTFTSSGFILIRYDDILTNAIASAKASWDESVDTSINDAQDAFLGHWLRNNAIVVSDQNEIFQEIYDTMSVANATGVRLDHLLALLGISRPGDVASTAPVTLTSDRATTVSAGSQYKTASGLIFSTDSALVFTGSGNSTVGSTCTIYGPNEAAIGEINTIVTSTPGITAVTNAAAATPGRLKALCSEQKATHTIAVATTGLNDVGSIYEALVKVTGVSGASVIHNPSAVAVDGVPAYNIHCVVIGGTGALIAAAIAGNKVSSVPTYGSTTVSHYNTTTKQSENIKYTIGTAVPIYIDVEYTLTDGVYPDDWQVQMRDNLVTHFSTFRIGDDVDYFNLASPLVIAGVKVTALRIDTTSTPVGVTDEVMSSTQLATFTLAAAATNLTFTATP